MEGDHLIGDPVYHQEPRPRYFEALGIIEEVIHTAADQTAVIPGNRPDRVQRRHQNQMSGLWDCGCDMAGRPRANRPSEYYDIFVRESDVIHYPVKSLGVVFYHFRVPVQLGARSVARVVQGKHIHSEEGSELVEQLDRLPEVLGISVEVNQTYRRDPVRTHEARKKDQREGIVLALPSIRAVVVLNVLCKHFYGELAVGRPWGWEVYSVLAAAHIYININCKSGFPATAGPVC